MFPFPSALSHFLRPSARRHSSARASAAARLLIEGACTPLPAEPCTRPPPSKRTTRSYWSCWGRDSPLPHVAYRNMPKSHQKRYRGPELVGPAVPLGPATLRAAGGAAAPPPRGALGASRAWPLPPAGRQRPRGAASPRTGLAHHQGAALLAGGGAHSLRAQLSRCCCGALRWTRAPRRPLA